MEQSEIDVDFAPVFSFESKHLMNFRTGWYIFTYLVYIRWVSVVEFHDPTLGIGKVFGQESTVVKWN